MGDGVKVGITRPYEETAIDSSRNSTVVRTSDRRAANPPFQPTASRTRSVPF